MSPLLEQLLLDWGLALGKALTAMFVVWATLRLFDSFHDKSFNKDFLPALLGGNVALAVYLGCRFVGASLLGGLTFFIPI